MDPFQKEVAEAIVSKLREIAVTSITQAWKTHRVTREVLLRSAYVSLVDPITLNGNDAYALVVKLEHATKCVELATSTGDEATTVGCCCASPRTDIANANLPTMFTILATAGFEKFKFELVSTNWHYVDHPSASRDVNGTPYGYSTAVQVKVVRPRAVTFSKALRAVKDGSSKIMINLIFAFGIICMAYVAADLFVHLYNKGAQLLANATFSGTEVDNTGL